jgi:hypothetical protein
MLPCDFGGYFSNITMSPQGQEKITNLAVLTWGDLLGVATFALQTQIFARPGVGPLHGSNEDAEKQVGSMNYTRGRID